FWQLGEKWAGRGPGAKSAPASGQPNTGGRARKAVEQAEAASHQVSNNPGNLNSSIVATPASTNKASKLINRLSNTTKSVGQLAEQPETQTVLPYEPYFKLKPALLELAINQKPLPGNTTLNLLVFPDAREATMGELKEIGAEVVGEDRSPFGPVLRVRPPV